MAFVSRRVLIDSGAYLALSDPAEAHHSMAQAIAARLDVQRWRPFTTNFVVAETHALILSRRSRRAALRVLRQIDASTDTAVVRVSAGDERRAREVIHRYTDKDFSLTTRSTSR